MGFKYCDENCNKEFFKKSNRNKHERNKGHAPGNVNTIIAIPYDTSERNINVQNLFVQQPQNIENHY